MTFAFGRERKADSSMSQWRDGQGLREMLQVHSALATRLGLPCYSPDGTAAAVDRTLSAVDCLCGADYDEISVNVQKGIVTLRGHTLTRALRDRLEQAARSVPGVLGVDSGLADDGGLAVTVAQTLAG